MVEGTIAFPIYICLLLATFTALRANYCRFTLQFALTDAARQSSLDSPAGVAASLQNRLSALGVTWNPATDFLTVCPQATFTNPALCPRGSIVSGMPLQQMVYRAELGVNFLIPGGAALISNMNITVTSTVLSRNEPQS